MGVRNSSEQWMPSFSCPQPTPEFKIEFVDTDTAESAGLDQGSERLGDSGNQDHMPDEQATPDDAHLHAAIVADRERMHADLTKLLTRWRESPPCKREEDDADSMALKGGHVSTMTESMDVSGSGESVGDRTGADTANAEATRSDRSQSFWSSLSLTELAEAQGVAPVEDLNGMAALWPSDDNPDEVLAHVLAERAARRRVVTSDPHR